MILKILKHYCEKLLYGFMQRLKESSNVIIKPLQGHGQCFIDWKCWLSKL